VDVIVVQVLLIIAAVVDISLITAHRAGFCILRMDIHQDIVAESVTVQGADGHRRTAAIGVCVSSGRRKKLW
jgi:hypothetical protein